MIDTFYGLERLDSSGAWLAALIIGFFFGLALERAGFGSSRRLAGIFYFRDMAVAKVMFTALITAMLGLSLCHRLGFIDLSSQVYYMPTYYGTHIVAGLLFGVGFVMAGWCPGTAAVGLASGRIDALLFLIGGIIGSILFNELFPVIQPIYEWGQSRQVNFGQPGLAFVYQSFKMSQGAFMLLFTLAACGCFWGVEVLERHRAEGRATAAQFHPFLRSFSMALVIVAVALLIVPLPTVKTKPPVAAPVAEKPVQPVFSEKAYLTSIESAQDHVDPETLANLLYRQNAGILAVDVRPVPEYQHFHIRGAVNVQLPDLPAFVASQQSKQMIVLYSNGMTHPAQARDILYRRGYRNVYILTDGLVGFRKYCLKPVSLRSEPVPAAHAARINAWREYFERQAPPLSLIENAFLTPPQGLPAMIDTVWLAKYLERNDIKVVDCRNQPDYNSAHIPGSLAISCESFRGVVDGVPSVLLPPNVLACKLSLLNIAPNDLVVIVYGGERVRDATLIGMVFERLGHQRYALLNGGFDKWAAEGRPVSNTLPPEGKSTYPPPSDPDTFTVDYLQVRRHLDAKDAIILDVRPQDYFTGKKTDEARGGHIPGAVNRNFKDDLTDANRFMTLKPVSELQPIYANLIPSKAYPVIVHCRTGHQASQTFFVLKHLLKYQKVFWYDAGWTEWAARPGLPVVLESG